MTLMARNTFFTNQGANGEKIRHSHLDAAAKPTGRKDVMGRYVTLLYSAVEPGGGGR